jgi:hypothetical protein
MIEALIEVIFDAISADERDGDKAIFGSGYGSGPVIINVRFLANEVVSRKDEWLKEIHP